MTRRLIPIVFSSLLAFAASAFAYPDKPITLIVPAPPGGMTDAPLRMVMEKVAKKIGQPIIIDYKPGASGQLGLALAMRSRNDGYTLVAINSSLIAVAPVFSTSVKYNVKKDLTLIAGMNTVPITLMINPTLPIKDFRQFVDFSKKQQTPLDIAIPGAGTLTRLIGEALKIETGMNVRFIPYKGDAAGVTDVIGGHVQGILTGTPQSYADSGQLRALAVSSAKPTAALPHVPSMSDIAPGFDMVGLGAIGGPAGIPRHIVEMLSAAINEAVRSPDVSEQLLSRGLGPLPLTATELQKYLDNDLHKLTVLKEKTGITTE